MIYIAGDKHGYKAIQRVEEYLKEKHIEYKNVGVKTENEDVALEEMIPRVTSQVVGKEENKGILTCGTGVGVEVGANKFAGIRAVLATSPQIAQWSVEKDKCNVLCLVGWDVEKSQVYKILDAWFGAKYDGSEDRLKMMKVFDSWH